MSVALWSAAPLHAIIPRVSEPESVLSAALAEARRAWPELAVDGDRFLAHLAERARSSGTPVDKLCLPDLYLAQACAAGVPGAVEALERTQLDLLDGLLARLGATGAHKDEVKQRLRERLLVGPRARIAAYSGRGDLRRWLKVVATREAVELMQKQRRSVSSEDDALADAVSPGESPELELLKRTYRAEFREAFQDALRSLEARPRTLLRYYLLDGLNIDQIGAIYGVHRATAARWIERVREDLLLATRERLMRRIKVDRGELESIMRLIQSQLDVSIQRFLTDESPSSEKKEQRS